MKNLEQAFIVLLDAREGVHEDVQSLLKAYMQDIVDQDDSQVDWTKLLTDTLPLILGIYPRPGKEPPADPTPRSPIPGFTERKV